MNAAFFVPAIGRARRSARAGWWQWDDGARGAARPTGEARFCEKPTVLGAGIRLCLY